VGLEGLGKLKKKITSSGIEFSTYSPLKIYERFGDTIRLHLQGQRISQARNHHEAVYLLPASVFLFLLSLSTHSPSDYVDRFKLGLRRRGRF
jgi:hypothetical protein